MLYVDDDVPRTHNIRILVERFEDSLPETVEDEYYELFESLTIYYLNGRYTDYKQRLSAKLNGEEVKSYYEKTKEAFAWLLTMKPLPKP